MRLRRIAILIDGDFFTRRLRKLVEPHFCTTPEQIADSARHLCKRHVQRLTGLDNAQLEGRWLDHVYRLFYYDAEPWDGVVHHPILNRRQDYSKSDAAEFRRELFAQLRRKRKFALRLGHVNKENDWQISPKLTKRLLKTRQWLETVEQTLIDGQPAPALDEADTQQLQKLLQSWRELEARDVQLGLRQKGVDMRIGLDIASITLKQQADTIVLVTGDSDFIPAAKLARREGVEFLLDPMWQSIKDDLHEHVDGLISAFPNPHANHNDSDD